MGQLVSAVVESLRRIVTVGGTVLYHENGGRRRDRSFRGSEYLAEGKQSGIGAEIYAMGWSNGAAMAILYALDRPVGLPPARFTSAPDSVRARFNDPCRPQNPGRDDLPQVSKRCRSLIRMFP